MELDKLCSQNNSSGGPFGWMDVPPEETHEGEHSTQKETTDQEPTVGEKNFLQSLGCTLLPSGFVARSLTRGLIVFVSWAVLWSIDRPGRLTRGEYLRHFRADHVRVFWRVSCSLHAVYRCTSTPWHARDWIHAQ